jgi:HK97 family phage major capsid protein
MDDLDLSLAAGKIIDRARREGRQPTEDEIDEAQALLARADARRLSKNLGSSTSAGPTYNVTSKGGPGDQSVMSAGYKRIQDPTSRPDRWSTGPIPLELKGTLTETTAGGPGGGLVPPDYRPGVVQTLFQPLSVAELLAQEQTSGSQIRYVVEGTATNATTAVAEGALKPESTLGLSETVEPIRKLATWLPVSDEMIEDGPAVQAYINSRLTLFVSITEEQQLLYGDGNAPNLQGILNRSGIQTHNAAGGTAIAEIRKMITKSRNSFIEPDALLVHPTQWESIELYRTTTGEFQVDPFRAGPRTLWGLPGVVTNVIGSGTCLVGSFKQAARLYRRGAMSVEASNSHDDFFRRNLVAIRAERREGLAVFRPASFVRGTALA